MLRWEGRLPMNKKPIVAILYDFDSTLATSDMQNFGFIPALGMTPAEFWGKTTEFSNVSGVERTLSYLYMMCYMMEAFSTAFRVPRTRISSSSKEVF